MTPPAAPVRPTLDERNHPVTPTSDSTRPAGAGAVSTRRSPGRLTTAVAAGGLALAALAGCSGGSSAADATSAPASSTAATTTPTTPATPATTSAAPTSSAAEGQLVAITVADGRVQGPKGRVKVAKGSTVTLRVTSDVADEIHLHGYDKSVDVAKGGTAQLTFAATLPGVFEVELESRGLQLTQLQIQ